MDAPFDPVEARRWLRLVEQEIARREADRRRPAAGNMGGSGRELQAARTASRSSWDAETRSRVVEAALRERVAHAIGDALRPASLHH